LGRIIPLVRSDLPSGTVTFVFTDVEGSTKLLHELGAESYAEALGEHRRVIREAFTTHGGVEVDTQGDALFVAFPTAPGALQAATEAKAGLAEGPIRVRFGIHTGTPHIAEEGYVGVDVHRAARIAAAGHGGQVLVSAATAHLLEPSNSLLLVDLGEHRLKDLSAPERIFQLGADEFPPLKSLHQTNLPIPATPFLGREHELDEVLGLLSEDDVRLLTLTGAGGTGKTRLALQAAGGLADRYPEGVWWVPLAPLRDSELVLAEAGQALGAKNGLAEHIGDQRLLLLFDNFEHLVEAAPDVAGLLGYCPNLDLLVTSREPLHVSSEQEYAVPPLVHEEGVDLFVARARAIAPDFRADDAVSEICKRLDDLPLALELAAARVKALSAARILERLEHRLPLLTGGARDLPERQRTLRATIEWSYELLTPEEQRLFARLAVLRGGCTLEAAEDVCKASLEALQSLVDKSLLRYADERYWMLETIREYAIERLEESGEAGQLSGRHAEHFLRLAEEAEPHLLGRGAGTDLHRAIDEWLDTLEREVDNLRAALDWLEVSGEGQRAMRLAGALSEFWLERDHVPEGRRRLESALQLDQDPTAARAKALIGASQLARQSGDSSTARLRADEALALHRTLGDAWGTADSLLCLGMAVADEGEFRAARQIFEESGELFGELGDKRYALYATRMVAWMHNELGDRKRARAVHEANLGSARALHDRALEATTLGALASYAVDEGRVEDARSLSRESLRLYVELDSRSGIAHELLRCAGALAIAGDAVAATRLLSCSEALYEELGTSMLPHLVAENEITLAAIRAHLDEPAFAKAWEEGRSMTADEGVALALDALA
jgi:predicted ATPase/class 3 adenylate cyclase